MNSIGTTQSDDRARVLEAADIVPLVGEHVRLTAKGREFIGLCPFHDDHKPSMYVVPSKQIYHCFSCGAGGNALDFVINFHKMDFIDALRFLAERTGVELTPRRKSSTDESRPKSEGSSRAQTIAVNALALDFFRLVLRHPEQGALARSLIEQRGFTPEIVETFQLGAAADSWDALISTATKKGASVPSLLDAGLVKPPREGRGDGYDTFRNRLIFPIFDELGRPIAFGGRKLKEEDEPKYLNSPESRVFDKSSTLYALHLASRAIQRASVAIVTEGYTDAIACHQAGFTNVVATLGTALTARHARILQRLCDTIVLVFDGDAAGAKAADRAIEVFFSQPVDVRIAVLPTGVDPAELLAQNDGATRFADLIDRATDALDYRLGRLGDRLVGAGLSQRAKTIDEEIARLVELGLGRQPIIRRQMIVRKIATIAHVDESGVTAAVRRSTSQRDAKAARRTAVADADEAAQIPIEEAQPVDERRSTAQALGCLLCEPTLLEKLSEDLQDFLDLSAYAPGPLSEIVLALSAVQESGIQTTAMILDRLDDESTRRLAARLAGRVTQETSGEQDRLHNLFLDCVRRSMLERTLRIGADDFPTTDEAESTASSVADRIEARRQAVSHFGGDALAHATGGAG